MKGSQKAFIFGLVVGAVAYHVVTQKKVGK